MIVVDVLVGNPGEPDTELRRARPRARYPLPVSIGRAVGCDIQLDTDNRSISRFHAQLIEIDGGLRLINRAASLGATSLDGRALRPGENAPIALGQTIRIYDFTLKVSAPPPLILLIADRRDLKPRAVHAFMPATALVVRDVGVGFAVDLVADLAQYDTSSLADTLALAFYYDSGRPTVAVMSNPIRLPLLIDRAAIQQNAVYIDALDTIEIGALRLELHGVGEPATVCPTPACQALNAIDQGPACRLCGGPLGNTTRLPARG